MPRVRGKRTRVLAEALSSWEPDEFKNSVMEVGVVDPSITYDSGESVAQVAIWNEFGTKTAPPRPAIRTAIALEQPKLARKSVKLARDMLYRRKRFDTSAKVLAEQLVKAIKKSISDWSTPPNAPSTIKRKGFNDPLTETGLYEASIGYKLLKTRRDQVE